MLALVSSSVGTDPRLRTVVLPENIASAHLQDFLVEQMNEHHGNPEVLTLLAQALAEIYESYPSSRALKRDTVERWRDSLTDREACLVCEQVQERISTADLDGVLLRLAFDLKGKVVQRSTSDGTIVHFQRLASGIHERTVRFGRILLQALAMLENLERDPLH